MEKDERERGVRGPERYEIIKNEFNMNLNESKYAR